MKQKVAVVMGTDGLSGAQKRFLRIMKTWHSRGAHPSLIVSKALAEAIARSYEFSDFFRQLQQEKRIFCLTKARHPMAKFISRLRLLKYIRDHRIDIIHNVLSYNTCLFIKKYCRVQQVYEITSPDMVDKLLESGQQELRNSIDLYQAVSPSVYRRTLAGFTRLRLEQEIHKLVEAPIAFFDPAQIQFQTDYTKEKLIVYASRLIPRKNPLMFARAAKDFLLQFPDWKVAILGDGALQQETSEVLKEEIAEGRAIVQRVDNIYAYYCRSKIFASTITPDNYPSQSILEAMLVENAILATNIGDTHRFVSQHNGVLVDFSVASVLQGLKRLANDEVLLQKMGAASRAKVLADFDPAIYMRHLDQLYESLSNENDKNYHRSPVREEA